MEFEQLNPENIKSNLVRCSLYLTAFEFLKGAIETETWNFLALRFFDNEDAAKERFNRDVMEPFAPRRNGQIKYDKYYACARWLWERMNVIQERDFNQLLEIRTHRNLIAHQLPNILLDANINYDENLFNELQRIHRIIRLFWARITIDTDDEFAGMEISDDDISTPPVSLVDYIASIIQPEDPKT